MIDLDPTELRRLIDDPSEPLVVEFHASWCPFGALIGPKLRRIEQTFGSRVRVARFDVEGSEGVATDLGIAFVPAVAAYHQGILQSLWYGDPPLGDVLQAIESLSTQGATS